MSGCYFVTKITGERVQLAGSPTPGDPCTHGIVVLGDDTSTTTFTVAEACRLVVRLLLAIDDAQPTPTAEPEDTRSSLTPDDSSDDERLAGGVVVYLRADLEPNEDDRGHPCSWCDAIDAPTYRVYEARRPTDEWICPKCRSLGRVLIPADEWRASYGTEVRS